jgi:hypothetical protein
MEDSMQKILTTAAAILLLLVVGSIVYDQMGRTEVRATVNLQDHVDPFEAIPQLAPGEDIAQIKEVDRSTNSYEIVYRTHKRKHALLEWLLGSRNVEDAQVQ